MAIETVEPTLHQERVTKARCPHCGHEKHFTGSVIDSLLCPKCETQMTIVASTGPTVDDALKAFDQAARELPPERVEPRQQTIPGLKPKFDWESAMRSILDLRYEVRVAAARVEQKAGEKKLADKVFAEKQAALHQLEDDYATRVAELEAEVAAKTAALDGPAGGAPEDAPGKSEESTGSEPPAAPATAAVEERESSEASLLGTDGTPTSEGAASDTAFDETPMPHTLQSLMTSAGAVVPLDKILAWTPGECIAASTWAHAQIEACERGEHFTAVPWPDHVARDRVLSEIEPRRKPKRRKKPDYVAIVSGGPRGGKTRKAGQKK